MKELIKEMKAMVGYSTSFNKSQFVDVMRKAISALEALSAKDLQTEIDRLRFIVDEQKRLIDVLYDGVESTPSAVNFVGPEEMEAKIDSLMFEYCPDEMTPAQIAEFEKHQRPTEDLKTRCYQCDKPVSYLFPDSRCGDCTRLTPDQIRGDEPIEDEDEYEDT